MSADPSEGAGTDKRFAPWRVIDRKHVFAVPDKIEIAVETVELPDGRIVDDYWQVRLRDFVVVFAETEARDVICLRQYRHGPRCESLELVAGLIELGEDAVHSSPGIA